MYTEQELIDILQDAGCTYEEIEQIVKCYQDGNKKGIEKMISMCRKNQLEKLHESQQCIDRLDFLSYKLEKTTEGSE